MNWVASKLTPSILDTVHKNTLKYPEWKSKHFTEWKPWLVGYDLSEEPYARYTGK